MNLGKIGDFILKDSQIEQEIRKSRENSAKRNVAPGRYSRENSADKNRMALNNRMQVPKPQVAKSIKKDEDLLLLMTNRLSLCEKQLETYRKELKELLLTNSRLKDENEQLKSISNGQSKQQLQVSGIISGLKDKNKSLEEKCSKMQAFLDSYGLKWQQGKSKENDEKAKNLNNDLKQPKFNYNLPSQIDINILQMRIQELNMIMEKEKPSEVIRDNNNMNRLKKLDPVVFGFYKNGLVIQGHPFHAYSSKEAQQTLADILEGYFPYMLKKTYPEGVPIKVLDRVTQDWDPKKKVDKMTIDSQDEEKLKPMKMDEFLNKLPQNIIKDGKVVGVRDDLSKQLQPHKVQKIDEHNNQNMDIVGTYEVPTPLKLKDDREEITDEEIYNMVTLKIRTENGKRTLIIKMSNKDSLADLYKITNNYSETNSYEIASNFPISTYPNDANVSLEQFHPSSALFLKKK